MSALPGNAPHLRLVFCLFILLQALLFAPRLNSDGAFYYEFLRSWVLQNDLNFHDEREFFTWEWVPVLKDFLPGGWQDTGYPPNIFSVGPSLIWLPFFILGHWLATLLNHFGAGISMTGYGVFHRFFPMMASMGAGLITIFILDHLGKDAGIEPSDRLAALMVWLTASHYPAFIFVTPAFSHAFSVLFVSLFVWLWYRSRVGTTSWKQMAILGIVLGLSATARWQNLFCLLLPAIDALADLPEVIRGKSSCSAWFLKWSAFAVALLMAVTPQLIATQALYGEWITDPQGEGGMHWFDPAFRIVLFDGIKGLFTLHPVLLPAVFAVPFLWNRNRRLTWGLLVLILSQSYINAVRRDWAGVGFGMRRFLNLAPAFTLGLMVVFAATQTGWKRKLRPCLVCLAVLLAFWNLLLMAQYYQSRLGAPWVEMSTREMIEGQYRSATQYIWELFGGSLLAAPFRSDPAGFGLGCLAIIGSLLLFRMMQRFRFYLARAWVPASGRSLLLFSMYWLAISGWLAAATASSRSFLIVDLFHPGQKNALSILKLDPESGFQGFAGGIRFGPGERRTILTYRPEYDRNRFLAPGRLIPVPGNVSPDNMLEWSFGNPVKIEAIDLISGIEESGRLLDNQPVAEILVLVTDGSEIRLPVRSGIETGCSYPRPDSRAVLIERRWPALDPIQSGIRDTRYRYVLPETVWIRSIRILGTGLPVAWTVRGLALLAATDRDELKERGVNPS